VGGDGWGEICVPITFSKRFRCVPMLFLKFPMCLLSGVFQGGGNKSYN